MVGPRASAVHGQEWLFVWLVDELDVLLRRLPDDCFFQKLRNLLMVSPLRERFRLVASRTRELSGLISSGSSPLNNLNHVPLGILGDQGAEQLIKAGFGKQGSTAGRPCWMPPGDTLTCCRGRKRVKSRIPTAW